MPPAFNLSQDQTLSFDLHLQGSLKRNRSELPHFFSLSARAKLLQRSLRTPTQTQRAPRSAHHATHTPTKAQAVRHQHALHLPAHAYRLLLVKEPLPKPRRDQQSLVL